MWKTAGACLPKGLLAAVSEQSLLPCLYFYLEEIRPRSINDAQVPVTDNTSAYVETAEEKELSEFVSVVLADTETVWTELFKKEGAVYSYPTLVLYSGSVQSACGVSSSSTGPFYCPEDHEVYIDLSFCKELQEKLKAPGDFAMAYVIAHEVGHHVQTLLGITDQVMALRTQMQ